MVFRDARPTRVAASLASGQQHQHGHARSQQDAAAAEFLREVHWGGHGAPSCAARRLDLQRRRGVTSLRADAGAVAGRIRTARRVQVPCRLIYAPSLAAWQALSWSLLPRPRLVLNPLRAPPGLSLSPHRLAPHFSPSQARNAVSPTVTPAMS